MFLAPWFAIGGLIAAAGPILIHFLNRRRYKVMEWAAMDFLREAIYRSPRIFQLRDPLLLLLRTLCIVGFGLAMARPFLDGTVAPADPNQPVHAVLLIDNSMSMGYQQLNGTLLDDVKTRAKDKIQNYPTGTVISVIPICGTSSGKLTFQDCRTVDDALEALMAIETVDRSASGPAAVDLALEACRRIDDLPQKQILLFTDQQVANWSPQGMESQLKQLPGPLQIVEVAADSPENSWVEDVKLIDGVADLQTPAKFVATLRHEGRDARNGVQVTLSIEGSPVATQTVDLLPGQSREVEFPPYKFDVPTEPGKPTFVGVEVSMAPDRLPADDQRFLVVPVVSSLPVVFVDQYGKDEDPRKNRFGETFLLRRYLAPRISRTQGDKHLIQVRHTTMGRLTREMLEDARVVVIAGASGPGDMAPTLREYVEQGGNLVIAAGGEFDPDEWTKAGWLDGMGILPAPLQSVTVGRLPSESPHAIEPFQLDLDSMSSEVFLIEATSHEELVDLYRLPYFFKAVAVKLDDETVKTAIDNVTHQIEEQRRTVQEAEKQLKAMKGADSQKLSDKDQKRLADLQQQLNARKPEWLLWSGLDTADDSQVPAQRLAEATRPQVLATYTNRVPFMVQRRVGRGRTVFVSTSVSPAWNTLPTTNTMLIFDRLLRGMIQQTIPGRTIGTEQKFVLPISAADRNATITLTGPNNVKETLAVDALGGQRYGVTVANRTRRGYYTIRAERTRDSAQGAVEAKLWEIPLAINGPTDESQLTPRDETAAGKGESRLGSLAGGAAGFQRAGLQGTDLWKWGLLAVVAGLLLELVILAVPKLAGERTA